MLLTEGIALHFKSSHLIRDVIPIIDKWRRDGAELVFDVKEFADTFDIVVETERQFNVFDTDRNGKIDAHEVLMVYILLSCGDVGRKLDTAISVYDFARSAAGHGLISFDEAVIMVNACVRGVQKVCEMTFTIPDDELMFHCKSLFDMHRVPHHQSITPAQLKEWVNKDVSPKHFVNLFHTAQGIGDIDNSVQRRNLDQGIVFQLLAHGELEVDPRALMQSEEFRTTLEDPTQEELHELLEMMLEDDNGCEPGKISNDRFHAILRPWNIFNECDQDKSHTLDDKEVEILLWFQLRQRPSQEFVHQFAKFIDEDGSGEISRAEWTQAIIQSERLARTGHRHAPSKDRSKYDEDAEDLLLDLANDPTKQNEKAPATTHRPEAAPGDASRRTAENLTWLQERGSESHLYRVVQDSPEVMPVGA
jgi:Ca2+-binding EF-hand superfamily protein